MSAFSVETACQSSCRVKSYEFLIALLQNGSMSYMNAATNLYHLGMAHRVNFTGNYVKIKNGSTVPWNKKRQ